MLSFAALNHVRSERDEWSLARMLEVNQVKADRFLAACRCDGHGSGGVFLVSTDKAADPVSLMGASKRAMELRLWAHSMPKTPASLLDGGSAAPLAERAGRDRRWLLASDCGSRRWWGLMARAAALVGNSSSAIFEAPSFDLAAVNIGRRQEGRLRLGNVLDVPAEAPAIAAALATAIVRTPPGPRRPHATAYGDGKASARVAAAVAALAAGAIP